MNWETVKKNLIASNGIEYDVIGDNAALMREYIKSFTANHAKNRRRNINKAIALTC